MNSAVVGLILVASVLTPSAFLIFDNATQSPINDLNTQFKNIMNETNSFLDHAWDIAKNFQNPDYNYDPSELGNYTTPSTPPNTTPETQLAANSS